MSKKLDEFLDCNDVDYYYGWDTFDEFVDDMKLELEEKDFEYYFNDKDFVKELEENFNYQKEVYKGLVSLNEKILKLLNKFEKTYNVRYVGRCYMVGPENLDF